MSDNDAREYIAHLMGAVAREDAPGIAEALGGLTMLAFMDLRRIADGVEKLSNFKLERVGDIVLGTTEHTEGLDLTPEEIETIEALRRGDIRTVSVSEPDERERRAIQLYRDYVARERERGIKMEMVPWAQVPEPTKTLWRQGAELDTGKGVKT